MVDIVRWLRDVAEDWRCEEAADEIERLRAENERFQERLNCWGDAADEIERLRRERGDEERRANILSDAIDYALNVSHEGLPWLDDWFHGEPNAMHELDAWRARSRAALGEEKK